MKGWFLGLCLLFPSIVRPSDDSGGRALLPDLIEPVCMAMDDSLLFIQDGNRILIYETEMGILKNIFGKVSDAPDGFRSDPNGKTRLRLDASSDRLVISNEARILFFTKQGLFLEMKTTYDQIDHVLPFDTRYIAYFYFIHAGTGKSSQHVLILNEKLEYEKKITEGFLGSGNARGFGGSDHKLHLDIIPDFFGFRVDGERIYVGDTSRGYHIDVYDSRGEWISAIEIPWTPEPIPESAKKESMDRFAKRYKKYWPHGIAVDDRKMYPAFRTFFVDHGLVSVFLHSADPEFQLVHILDDEGEILKTVRVPKAEHFFIRNGMYFYLVQNNYHEWELGSETLFQKGNR